MSLRRNVVANFLGQGWRALMGIAFIPVYIRLLGVESYALIGIFALLQAWLALFDGGLRAALAREMARFAGGARSVQSINDLLRTVEVIMLGIGCVVASCLMLAAEWIATSWLNASSLPSEGGVVAFRVMGAIIGLRLLESMYTGALAGLQRQVMMNVVSASMATLRALGAVVVLSCWSATIESFFLWQLVVSITSMSWLGILVYRLLPRGDRRGTFSMTELLSVWRFAGGMLAITSLALLLTQLDKLLLSSLLPLESFGYYVLAATVANALLLVSTPISTALLPKLTQLLSENRGEQLRDLYHTGAQLMSVLIGSAGAILVIDGDVLLKLWTQDAEIVLNASPLLRLLALGTLMNCMVWMPHLLQIAFAWTSLSIVINIAAVILVVPALLLVIPEYGAVGAASVWVSLNAGYLLVNAHLMHLRLLPEEKWKWYLQDVSLPVAATFLAVFAARKLMENSVDVLGGLLVLMTGCVVAIIVSVFTASRIRARVLSLLRSGRGAAT